MKCLAFYGRGFCFFTVTLWETNAERDLLKDTIT